MTRNSLGTLSLAVLSLMFTTGARAQSMEQADVPFTFQVGSVQLPSGHYEIKENHLRNSIRIYNLNTGAAADVLVRQSSYGAVKGALVFRNVGNQHFLAEVCGSDDSLNLTLPASKSEKQARALQVATTHTQDTQHVLIALK
jgi:hypothetical protein